jgi:uncharacterized small protein (TIGR04563 family)
MLDETQHEAIRQDRSISWIIQAAWRIAREEVQRLPGYGGQAGASRPPRRRSSARDRSNRSDRRTGVSYATRTWSFSMPSNAGAVYVPSAPATVMTPFCVRSLKMKK